jgi:hypothetical protein
MTPSTLRVALTDALASKRLTRLRRSVEPGDVDGFVVALDRHWMLQLLVSDGIRYNGFQAFRLRDIESVEHPSPRDAFYRQVLRLRRLRRPRMPKADLSSTEALIRSAARHFPLVTIHLEITDPDVCYIGRPVEVTASSLQLLEVSPDAEWDDEPTRYRTRDVTRVDFGGSYEDALALVACPPTS